MTPDEQTVLAGFKSILQICLKLNPEATLDILSECLTLDDLEELKGRWQ